MTAAASLAVGVSRGVGANTALPGTTTGTVSCVLLSRSQRYAASEVTGAEEQGPKQMIVYSRGLCKSPASPHGVEKHGENRVRYATIWRQYASLLVESKETAMFRKQ